LSAAEIDPRIQITLKGPKGAVLLLVKYFFQAINLIVLATGLLGFFVIANSRSGLVAALIGYSTLMYAAISCTTPRFNVPVLPLILIFSSACLVRMLRRPREAAEPS
jgi:hypothetical protein